MSVNWIYIYINICKEKIYNIRELNKERNSYI